MIFLIFFFFLTPGFMKQTTATLEISCVNVFPSGVFQDLDLQLKSKGNLIRTLGLSYTML